MLFVDGHVYPMFASLFGYGISQFVYSRIGRGVPAREAGRMLLRRHLRLLAFGAVHALLLLPASALLGGYAARHRWLEGLARRVPLRTVALWGIAVSVLGSLPVTLGYLEVWPQGELSSYGWLIVSQICGIAGGIGYAALFALLGLRFGATPGGAVRAIAAAGKRSLSFYLLQSLVFAPLLAAWGFGLGARIGSATAYLIALAVWLLSVGLAAWLEHRGNRSRRRCCCAG